ncbi:50S ribosomal protein L13 [candidate division WOR-1 bacterium RIFCSPLOWO2_02_FULL_46_20]|uniref:Large ribosomal subunit protein uL13 n=2 Tax=Saganbacteria TaxID=1703751 RepID=A0A1F4R4Y1_UNCSA|nr:MAG: 50S ribosomal protein L13 [candidate division WOR-1 bacterium RIFCSPHIGHO2_02_FULL_45_12]OGC03248.1 MAG: 50S ribosomal protein L13 [candidate division WOR-1 bacterium RIFCSPLOWO2_02_FULL_46_20]OGC08894.1 MAG: 50S ribosomal protein L13 [candidate division WOR-1 bacterium RIFCSPLOWO2_12_FULL_45_9]
MKKNKTLYARKETVKRDWYELDVAGIILGKVATRVATYLRGKHKAIFSPHVDCGDFIIIVNADKIRVSGKKEKDKMYFTHSGFPGGDKLLAFEEMMKRDPAKVVRHAVAGMLPKNRLGRQLIKKLKVYAGKEHPHMAHKIQKLEV